MTDLKNPRRIWLKAWLFLGLGLAGGLLAFLESPTLRQAFYLAVTIWAFCRLYFFAFHVIEHYLDPGFRFSGLWAFARYVWSGRGSRAGGQPDRNGRNHRDRGKDGSGGNGLEEGIRPKGRANRQSRGA